MGNGLITVKEAAGRLNRTPHYIRKLLREKKISGEEMKGKEKWRVCSESLESFKKTPDFTNDINALKQTQQLSIKDAVEDVEEYFDSDLISYIALPGNPGANIVHDDSIILDDFLNTMTANCSGKDGKKFKKLTLFLYSSGGILEAAIKFVDVIKHYANEFEVIVPMMAKSAASLICLSADTIHLTPLSELGPIDPIVQSPTNPNIQVPARAIDDFIHYYLKDSKDTNASDNLDNSDRALRKKIEDIDAFLLGNYKSALKFAKDQVTKCLRDKIQDHKKMSDAVDEFTTKHASHSFPITHTTLNEYGIGRLITEEASLRAVKTLLVIYQAFMANNKIVKTIGNRDFNKNTIVRAIDKNQIPARTSM